MGVGTMENNESVGQRIIAARKDLGMTQRELADLLHVSERSVQAYEGDDVVPWRFINDLAAILNRSPAWILHGEKAQELPGDLLPVLERISEDVAALRANLVKA